MLHLETYLWRLKRSLGPAKRKFFCTVDYKRNRLAKRPSSEIDLPNGYKRISPPYQGNWGHID